MAENITVARPYAEAVFRMAKEGGCLASWGDLLNVLSVMMEDSAMVAFVTSPKHTAEEVAKLIVELLGDQANAEAKNFIAALQDYQRLTLLPEIARQFELLKSREEGVVDAAIASAFPLNEAQTTELAAVLAAKYGKTVRLTCGVDADLIGGVRIKVGDDIIDASVRGKLQAMAVSLKS